MKTLLPLLIVFISFISCTTPRFPTEAESVIKYCFLGDVGKDSVAQDLVTMGLEHEKCHEIFFLGDIIYPNGLKDAEDKDFEVRFNRFYEKLTKKDHHPKLHIVLGNHDYRGNPDVWTQLASVRPEIYAPSRYYWKKIKEFCFVVLDSNAADFKEQEAWLKSQKEYWKNCGQRIALAHHSLISSGPNYKTASAKITSFYGDNIIGEFNFLLTGHEHVVEYMGKKRGTAIYISGAGGAVAKKHLPGYVTMEKMDHDSTNVVMKLKTIERSGKVNVIQTN
jgi:predicted phosphodiesterase